MEGFQKYYLRECCVKIASGATPKGGESVYTKSGTRLIRSQNVLDFSFSRPGLVYIDEKASEQLKNVRLQKRDVLLNITGDSVARVCSVPEDILPARVNQHVAIIRANERILNPDFLKYYLLNPSFKASMLSLAGNGATRKALTKGMIENFQISLPPLKEQQAIAEILSSLDDKIELNLQMNKTLEEMAMTLYKEWFVDFGPFKGGAFVESELGLIPEGWEVKKIGDIIETLGGGTPSTSQKEYWENGDVEWYSPTDLTKADSLFSLGTAKKITKLGLQKSSAKLFPPYCLLMSSRATIGAITINMNAASTNQGFITMIPNESISLYQLNGWVRYNMDLILSKANGSTFKEISKSNFRELLILVGTRTDSYLSQCKDIFNLIENNTIENNTLTQTRDTLLPKLISGEIRVKAFEKELAEVI